MDTPRVNPSPTTLRSLTSSTVLWKLLLALLITATSLALARDLLSITKTHDPLHPDRPLLLHDRPTFKIAIFSDLHFGEEEASWGPEQDAKSLELMRAVLAAEAPDLVVLNGDLITGENTFRENATAYVDVLVRPMVEAGVRWASTYGNHDSQFNLSREAVFDAESRYDLSQTRRADPELPGVTNYYLEIAHASAPDRPSAILWFFDSRGGSPYQGGVEDIPGWVAPQTASWFLNAHGMLTRKHSRVLPSLAFVHIPTSDYRSMQPFVTPALFPGQNNDDPAQTQSNDPYPGHPAASFADALLAAEGLHSVHAGHDHGNDWCVPAREERGARPFLCFGRHTGYGGYGKWARGARILELEFYEATEESWGRGMEVETWIRSEGGDVVGRVGLNQTYGVDKYSVDE
ncbi:hypothetical protein VUR80DRAFT_9206 [Thermomyces stellatus]